MLHPYAVVSLLAVPAALGAAPSHVAIKALEPHNGGFICGHEHRSVLDANGDVIVVDADDELARSVREHFENTEMVRASVNVARGGFDLQYNLDAGVAADAEFVAALEAAAVVWESRITDDAVVIVDVGYTSNVSYIAATSNERTIVDYDEFRAAVVADAGVTESAFVGALPDPDLQAETFGGIVSTSDSGFDGIEVTTANAKALNLGAGFGSDAGIVFNTDFDFDNDPSDGLTPDSIDTVYVMIHEIGHMLGFVSSVDNFFGGDVLTSLDTFRVGIEDASNNPVDLAGFSTVPREARSGTEAALDTVNGIPGAPLDASWRFSTGSFFGDGRQASHWKDDDLLGIVPNIGVMDPTTSSPNGPGQGANPGYITYADLVAFSVIGWDIDLGGMGCTGDLNGDSAVNSNDLAELLAQWGGSGAGDLDSNGTIDASDLAIMLAAWGNCSK